VPLGTWVGADDNAVMGNNVETIERTEQPIAVVRGRVQPDGIAEFLGKAFGDSMAVIERQHLHIVGAPFARYGLTDDSRWDIEAGFPVDALPVAEGRVLPDVLPGGTIARILYIGDYSAVGAAYETLMEWLPDNDFAPSGEPWEEYLDQPGTPNPRTEVYVPCLKQPVPQPAG